MSSVLELPRARRYQRAAALALTVFAIAGCSSEATRFNSNPFSSQSGSEVTGSVPPASAAPAGRVDARPLPQTSQLPPTPARPNTVPTLQGSAGGSRGMASYSPPSASRDITGSVSAPAASTPASPEWSWDGGTAVTVQRGDTVHAISRRYGVPVAAILQANNIASSAALRPGQRLVIPRYSRSAPVAAKPSAAPQAGAGVHVVAPGETLYRISRLYGQPVAAVARANNIAPHAKLNIGDRITIPGAQATARPPATPPKLTTPTQTPPGTQHANASPAPGNPTARMVQPAEQPPAPPAAAQAAEATGALPTLRWPVRGRVIAGFGPKTNGQQNDGINIAVPEGTEVKAAEDGVVAYAGNELKGYGNLVLVRHTSGYVTAYAHARELLVKRGDQVKRGQTIAKAGQTGNVNSPQLHFEVRKGPQPVDPMKFLGGA
jgi:murein DD-endopeptidase MepM/ murein hydrolase activator NlpD